LVAAPANLVVAFGEVLWDLLPGGAALGGAPANFAYRIQALGDRGVIVSRLGEDALGRRAAQQLMALGVDTAFLQWDKERPTGTVEVRVDPQGRPDFTILPQVAFDRMECCDDLLRLAAEARCICFGTLVQRTPDSRRALRAFLRAGAPAIKFLDLNLRRDCFSRETVLGSLERADVLKLNEDEAAYLAREFDLPKASLPEFASTMIERCLLSHCVITLGERGALAASARGECVYVPGIEVRVVDTVGAGDAFSAAFVHALLRGRPLSECCARGVALGAMVAAQAGAMQPIPPAALEGFLRAEHPRVREPSLKPFAVEGPIGPDA
jgi:fructokinase